MPSPGWGHWKLPDLAGDSWGPEAVTFRPLTLEAWVHHSSPEVPGN